MSEDARAIPLEPVNAECTGFSRWILKDRLLVVLMVFGLNIPLMQRYPIIYGGDPVARLVNYPRILNGHQLPLLQVLLHYCMRWFYGPTSIFLLMALVSAVSCAGLHALVREITRDRRAAWLAAIFYATHSFILFYSRVPYQEPLLMAGIFWGYYYLFRPASATSRSVSSLFIALACFSRYEGWIAALTAALFQIGQDRQRAGTIRLSSIARALAAFGWAPVLWIIWNRGLSPAGTYVLDLGFDWGRLYRPYFIAKSTLWWSESGVVLLAVVGLASSGLDQRQRRDGRPYVLLGLPVLLLAALLFSGHGIQPDATRIVTEREAFVPISILVLYGGMGGSWLMGGFEKGRIRNPLLRVGIPLLAVLLSAGYGLNRGLHRVAAANDDPDLKTDYQVACFLADRQASGLIFAAPLPREWMKIFIDSAEKWGGSDGKEKALRLWEGVETTPLDYQRTLIFSWLGKTKLFSGDQIQGADSSDIEGFLHRNRIDYLVVFSDFRPVADQERVVTERCAERSPVLVIHNGNKTARIYAVRSPL